MVVTHQSFYFSTHQSFYFSMQYLQYKIYKLCLLLNCEEKSPHYNEIHDLEQVFT